MPVKIPASLPAVEILKAENIFVMDDQRASTQDIRPLKLLILNLMPLKIVTETDLLRLISNTPLQIELDLMNVSGHISRNTPVEHIDTFYKDFSEIRTHNYDGSTYQMKEGSVRLVVENGRCVLIPPDDPRFRKQGASLNVFMVSDPRINRNTVRSMDVIVRSLKARLDGTISDDPDTTLSLIAGRFAPLLGYTVMPDGTLSVSVKRDAMKRFHENAGKALILTRSSSWDDIIKARETLVNINAAMEQFFKGSRWVLKYIVKGTDMEGQMFAEFVAMLIYDSILRTLRSCGDGSDVDETVFVASTYMMSIINGRTVRSNVNRKQRRLFDMFGLDPYKCPIGFETRKHVGIHGALSETSGPD